MNIGMCLHRVYPAISDGDRGVSQTQTEHDIFLTSACPTRAQGEKNTQTHISNYKVYWKMFKKKTCTF